MLTFDPLQALDAARVIVVLLDSRGFVQHVNSYFERFTGFSVDEVLGREWWSTCLATQERERAAKWFRSALARVPTSDNVMAAVLRNGQTHHIEWNSQVVRRGDGCGDDLMVTGIDVTERVGAEAKLRQTLDRLDAMLEALPDLLFEVDQSGRIFDYPAKQSDLFAVPPAHFLGKTFAEVFAPDVAEAFLAAIREAADQGVGSGKACRVLLADGGHWFEPMVSRKKTNAGSFQTFVFLARDVTPRMRLKEHANQSEDRFRQLVENSPYCIHELDKEGRFVSMNPAGLRMIDQADEACVIGRRCLDFVSEADRPRIAELLTAAQNGQKSECEFACKNGCFIRSNFVPIVHGKVMGISLDITKQVQIETALSQSEARYRRAERAANDGVWEWNIATGKVYFSPRFSDMLGYAEGELPMNISSFKSILHPEEKAGALEVVKRQLRDGQLIDMEIRLRCKGGDYLWVHTRGLVDHDATGKPIMITGTNRDISERKQAAAALQQERDRLRQILDAQFGFVSVLSVAGDVLEVNQAPLELMKLSRDEVLGRRFWEVGWLHPQSALQTQAAVAAAARGETVRGVFTATFPDLGKRDVDSVFAPLRDSAGLVVNVIACGVDITECTHAVEALQKSEARLNEAQRIACVGCWELTYATMDLAWSDEIFRIFEINRSQFGTCYESFLNAIHPEDREMVNAAYNASVASRQPYDIIHRLLMPDGRVKFVRERCETDYDAAGTPLRSVGTVQDITERMQALFETQQLRDTLAHANRLETLSELASGLAHELNQPLGVISVDASTALYMSQGGASAELQTCLQRISDQAFRAGEIVRRIRSFIRRDSSVRKPHDLNLLVREVLMMLGDHLRHNSVTIQLNLAPVLPLVMVDGIQIQQVLVNLVRNADDAMSQLVGTRRVLSIETEAIAQQVRVKVSDNGCGLDPVIVDRLFFPFQTTKAAGLGLGLVTCRTIIEAHGGHIEARSNPLQGTSFTFTLPVG